MATSPLLVATQKQPPPPVALLVLTNMWLTPPPCCATDEDGYYGDPLLEFHFCNNQEMMAASLPASLPRPAQLLGGEKKTETDPMYEIGFLAY